MACPFQFRERKAVHALRTAGLRQTASLGDRAIAGFTEQKRMRRQNGLGGEETCSQRLIDTLLNQVISEVYDINHDQYPASFD
jgi:hypothetical protein